MTAEPAPTWDPKWTALRVKKPARKDRKDRPRTRKTIEEMDKIWRLGTYGGLYP